MWRSEYKQNLFFAVLKPDQSYESEVKKMLDTVHVYPTMDSCLGRWFILF